MQPVVVVKADGLVLKAHQSGTDGSDLARRLGIAAHPALRGILLPPKDVRPTPVGDRWVTLWPEGTPVSPDPDTAPWSEAGELLAALHQVEVDLLGAVPRAHTYARMADTVAELASLATPDAVTVSRAWASVPAPRAERRLVHGDWHLGQLVARDGHWLLIDIDDLGLGDPAWDLGRIAGFWAAGLLPADAWPLFLGAYRNAGGPAGRTWSEVDAPARAYLAHGAARALLSARDLDEVDQAMIAACHRMTSQERENL